MTSFVHMTCNQKNRRDTAGGFSLIELSIVFIVMGLLLVPFIKGYDIYQTQKRLDDTKIALSFINTALANFYAEHGRYPCPADRSLGFDDAGHGIERCQRPVIPPAVMNPRGFEDLAAGECNGAGVDNDRGFCRAQNSAGNDIFIGSVPYVTLDIPAAQTMDGWKNSLTYAVTATMSDQTTFDPNDGAVDVINEHGTPVGFMHGIVISSGKDGMGAFDVEGREKLCVAGTVQEENCDNDAVFMSSINLYEADTPLYYDDLVMTNDWTQSGIWSYVDGVDIQNTNTGNIGIGTQTPAVKLDVVGDVRASQQLRTTQFCNADGTICFPAANIGGTGMHCPAGQIAYGIQNNTLLCRAPFAVTGSCGANQYVSGINAGGVVCANLP